MKLPWTRIGAWFLDKTGPRCAPGILGVGVVWLALLPHCAGPSGGTIRIVATDDGFEFPAVISAGMVHLVFENRSSTIHEVMFIKLPEDMSGEDYLDQVRSRSAFPPGALDYSGPGLTSPGKEVEMWLHLDPGTYLLGCWFTSHLTSLPPHVITVEQGESSPVAPPKEDVTLRMIDFRFELEGALEKGSQVLKVETVGPSIHEVDIFRLKHGKTLDDLTVWQNSDRKTPPPAEPVAGVLDSHDISRAVWLRASFRPGRYVMWCGLPVEIDESGGAGDVTHADAGMVKEFVIGD